MQQYTYPADVAPITEARFQWNGLKPGERRPNRKVVSKASSKGTHTEEARLAHNGKLRSRSQKLSERLKLAERAGDVALANKLRRRIETKSKQLVA